MPISTDLNISPYFDDHDPAKDYYRILFQPGVPVQTRELNQLQTLLQQQIERFGDNIFKSGTIIDGCNITAHESIPFIKVKDRTTAGNPVDVTSYEGMYVKSSSNLNAYIVKSSVGFEASPPNLNTLYLKYLNSGSNSAESSFTANQILTVYDPDSPIFSINIANGSSGFSNSDIVIITPAIEVQNSTGGNLFSNGFFAGDFITNGLGANLEIVFVSNNDANNSLILGVSPKTSSLIMANSAQYTMNVDDSIIDNTTLEVATIIAKVGTGAAASLITDTLGKVSNVYMTSTGNGYYANATIRVQSTTANTSQVDALDLVPINYLDKITVANSAMTPTGSGYGVTVGNGVIYQKGYFLRVEEQLAIVEKYGAPDSKVIGFTTEEQIIDSFDDESLLDNALGTRNETAPGANRLKLTPVIEVVDKISAEANAEFLSIMEFSDGRAYKQATHTQYNIINDEMAKRSKETNGNFVLDEFLLTTTSPNNFEDEANNFSIVVDKGVAYINGYRVETIDKYTQDITKGKEITSANSNVSTNYGNYIRVNDFGGHFVFNTNELFELRDTAANYSSGTVSPPGSVIGYCRVRSIVCEDASTRTYKIYIYDVRMNANKNFKDSRAIYYNGTNKGVADIILDANNNAVVYDNNLSGLLFNSGLDALESITNVSYKYRSYDDTLVANTTGFVAKTLSSNETFPYVGTLSTAEELDLILIPQANITATSNLSGSATTSSTANSIVGSGTNFLNEVLPGDFIKIANSTANTIGRVSTVANNTYLTLSANAGITITGNVISYYPQNVPVNLQSSGRSANVSANGQVLTINLGSSINSANVILMSDILVSNASATAKTINRDQFVRLDLANNSASNTGPWCLGASDIFRLKGVYLGANNTFTPSDSGITDITNEFYIDHNQNEDFLNSGYLVKKPSSTYSLATTDNLLVKLDCFSGSDGITFINSYNLNDGLSLANSSTTINTLEIPEVFGLKDTYYDLRDCIDFRCKTVNTAILTANSSLATINPSEPSNSDRFSASAKKYPVPYGSISGTFTFYNSRKDMIVIDESSEIRVVKGTKDGDLPEQPLNSMIIDELSIPAYPSLPLVLSNNEVEIADTKIANEKYSNRRLTKYTVSSILTSREKKTNQPKIYTMADIGKLENRIETLEYYVSFNLQENAIKNKSIRSATDNLTERFKFGFFADSFEDETYSDYNNPQFAAEFMNGRLVPPSDKVNIQLELNNSENKTGSAVLAPFNEYTLISQPYATDIPVPPSTSNTSANNSANTTANTVTVVQSITSQLIANKNRLTNVNGSVFETSEFFMSSLAGPVEIYFNFRDNKAAIEVFQGSSAGFSLAGLTPVYNSLNAQALTAYDKGAKAYGMGKLEALNSPVYMGTPSKPATEDAGKILFTHNPDNGQYYKIVVTKYRKSGNADNWKGKFFYRIFYPVDSEITVTSVGNPKGFNYNGTAIATPNVLYVQSLFSRIPGAFYNPIASAQKITLECYGLRPNTIHNLYLDDILSNTIVQPDGKAVGESIVTDSSGKAKFDVFYMKASSTTSDFTWKNVLLKSLPISRKIQVKSSDSTSTASVSIPSKLFETTINNIKRK